MIRGIAAIGFCIAIFAGGMSMAGQDDPRLDGLFSELKAAETALAEVQGELDALLVPDHPRANPETGAAHACGHNAQIAGLIGAATALTDPNILRELSGSIVLMAVPAEEYVEVEYRHRLVKDGQLEFLGGKPELIRFFK